MRENIDYKVQWDVDESGSVFCRLEFLPTNKVCSGIHMIPNSQDIVHQLREVVVPEGVDELEPHAFSDCLKLKRVVLPQSLKKIGYSAFEHCIQLEDITLPDNLEIIEKNAFNCCTALDLIEIPDSVTRIGSSAFSEMFLTKVKLGNGIEELPMRVFEGCYFLKSIKLPANLKTIHPKAFANCINLENIDIPDGVESIMTSAFASCVKLKELKLPSNLRNLGSFAFGDCRSIESVEIPDGITELYDCVFKKCEALKEVKLSKNLKKIEFGTFMSCSRLKTIDLPEGLEEIGESAFYGTGIYDVEIPSSVRMLDYTVFTEGVLQRLKFNNPHPDLDVGKGCCFSEFSRGWFAYFDKKSSDVYLTEYTNDDLAKFCYVKFFDDILGINYNFRKNFLMASEMREARKIKYIPPNYVLSTIPPDKIQNFFKNKNDIRYRSLMNELQLNTIVDETEKSNAIIALLKIYYALGGFSENKGESETAYNYVLNEMFCDKINPSAKSAGLIAHVLHDKFDGIVLDGDFNRDFAKFFMKYYGDDHEFMVFRLKDKMGNYMDPLDYICPAHNSFNKIQELYPYRLVNTTEENAKLTPRFVAEHCTQVFYNNVENGNEGLAELVGSYGYTQAQFEKMQKAFNKAKTIKDKCVIFADKAKENDSITYRVLEKDDPLGFVLGDITNCCQRYGRQAESCVEDGYTNENSAFIIFEESVLDQDGNNLSQSRILGQAYVWYDPETKTVCYDNIEIPTAVIGELKSGAKHKDGISYENFIRVLKNSAVSIVENMTRRGFEVERVTTGYACNDLKTQLYENFGDPIVSNLAKHRNYFGYSDAKNAQFVILDVNYEDVNLSDVNTNENNIDVM